MTLITCTSYTTERSSIGRRCPECKSWEWREYSAIPEDDKNAD